MGKYKELKNDELIKFIKDNTSIFSKNSLFVLQEIGDGNINFVYRVIEKNSNKSVILKQALPYVRIVGASWPLSLDRARIEAETEMTFKAFCPENIPEIYYHNSELAATIFEDLGNLNLMRFELMKMHVLPEFAKQIGKFLARTFLFTSDLVMDAKKKKENLKKFVNPDLCKIVEDLVFTDPFKNAKSNNINPEILEEANLLWNNTKVILESTCLKELYMNKSQSLIHGDLHTGSIFADKNNMYVFDSEFAFYGPPSYDMGCVVGSLLLNFASWDSVEDRAAAEIRQFRVWLLNTIFDVFKEFENEFNNIWSKNVNPEYRDIQGYKNILLGNYLKESMGFAGCECIRRTLGLAQVPDFTTIDNLKLRVKGQKISLLFGKKLLYSWKNITDIKDILNILELKDTLRGEL